MSGISHHDITEGLHRLGLGKDSSVIVHSSLSSFDRVNGGASTVCAVLRETCRTILMPAAS